MCSNLRTPDNIRVDVLDFIVIVECSCGSRPAASRLEGRVLVREKGSDEKSVPKPITTVAVRSVGWVSVVEAVVWIATEVEDCSWWQWGRKELQLLRGQSKQKTTAKDLIQEHMVIHLAGWRGNKLAR
jgi:hypothetical protein